MLFFYFLRISSGLVWLLNRTKCKENKTVTFVCHTFMMRFPKWELILFCLCGFEIFFLLFIIINFWFLFMLCDLLPQNTNTHIISVKWSGCKTHHIQLKICSCFSIFIALFFSISRVNWIIFDFFCCCLETNDRFVMCHHANECYKIIIYCQ